MFCERCKKNEATIHLSEVVKNMKSEVHLCEQCAREVGLNTKISNFTLSLPEMLTFLNVDESPDFRDQKRCHSCGCSFPDYRKNGKLGCPDCYDYFSDELAPVLASFFGDKRHVGKSPQVPSAQKTMFVEVTQIPVESDLDILRTELESAVHDERYEDAAVLRDRIREISGSFNGSGR
ncbi:MAG TPA: UvrB/UvrC motif-containing protein [Spirochaetota bacterium]|nr:UvrB/UvrC motif-containing protein [Spirochaetota bacterium]